MSAQPEPSLTGTALQFSMRGLLIFFVVLSCLCGGLVCVRDALRSPHPPGIVTKQDELPLPWRDILELAQREGVEFKNIEYYRVYSGLSSDHSIRMDYSPDVLAFLLKVKGFRPAAGNIGFAREFREKTPKKWLNASNAGRWQFYESHGIWSRSEGDLYLLMYDPAAAKIYIYYSFNF